MGRDVKNDMTSFTNFECFHFCVGVGVGVGVAFAWAFAFACHVHAQGKHFQGTCSGACFLATASLGGKCCTLSRVESPGMI
jgi:transcriptional regulator GlxA family with amidase domain